MIDVGNMQSAIVQCDPSGTPPEHPLYSYSTKQPCEATPRTLQKTRAEPRARGAAEPRSRGAAAEHERSGARLSLSVVGKLAGESAIIAV